MAAMDCRPSAALLTHLAPNGQESPNATNFIIILTILFCQAARRQFRLGGQARADPPNFLTPELYTIISDWQRLRNEQDGGE